MGLHMCMSIMQVAVLSERHVNKNLKAHERMSRSAVVALGCHIVSGVETIPRWRISIEIKSKKPLLIVKMLLRPL